MANVLVLYYSMYGHLERMAQEIAHGAASVPGAKVDLRRVPETMAAEAFAQAGGKTDQAAPVAQPAELTNYDAILFGTPTRFGNMCSQMRAFLDQTGPIWYAGGLVGKLGSVFASSATQHGGQESTLLSFHTTLLHHGMLVAGLPYQEQRQIGIEEIKGGSPYGATTITGMKGERWPSDAELAMARFQGEHVSKIASKLFG